MPNALRDTRRISHGNPWDKRNTADVWQGVKDAYINSIQAAPEWLLEQMAPQDPYTPGELRETPRGAVRSLGLHREQDIAQRSQDIGRDYKQGLDYGTGLGMVADPYIDGPFAIAGALSKFGKLAHPAKRGSGNALSRLVRDERGALDGEKVGAFKTTGNPPEGYRRTTLKEGTGTNNLDEIWGENANIDSDAVAEYMRKYKNGEPVEPPMILAADADSGAMIYDGHHRLVAAEKLGILDEIPIDIR